MSSDVANATVVAPTGYVTDVAYPRTFVPQIAPPTLRLVAAINGHPVPPDDDFDYCELGCAAGDTLTAMAAANPSARFVGLDLSEEAIRRGRERAARGAVANVRFVQQDIEGPLRDDLPLFDFIAAHGVWTWVSAAKREALLAFVRARLKPGGLFYMSYNALPGWAAVEPLRRLLRDLVPPGSMSTLERAREAVARAQRLCDSGAAYFTSHPTAKSMLALMQKGGLGYVVHEYFHDDWAPMYFVDVARILGARGLSYLGQVPLHANVRELAIPPSLKKLAETVTDRVTLEGLKDFANNEMFRNDVFVKGSIARSASETRYYFEGTSFGTLAPLAHVKREVRVASYTLEYAGPIYDAILARIAARPCTAMELALVPELAQVGQLRIGDGLRNLVLGGQVVPMRAPPPRAAATTRGFDLPDAYNRLALEEALADDGPLVLASNVTGAGVHISLLDALAIRLVTDRELAPSEYADAVRAFARARTMPLVLGDRKIKDGDELARIMAREIERFRAGPEEKLVALGVLAPRA